MAADTARDILITGGAGFIGSHLVERLSRQGRAVTILDNFDDYYDPQIKRDNLRAVLAGGKATLVEGDIRDGSVLEAVFTGNRFDLVVHLAACAGVRASVKNPRRYMSVNVEGTAAVLEAAVRAGVRRFILASSSSVYGPSDSIPFSEDDPCTRQLSPYAASKRAAELVACTDHALYGIQVWALRFFTAYGPRQRPDMAIHKFVAAALESRPITLYGDGGSIRDYTYIDDIISGVEAAVDTETGFEIVNLGRGQGVRLDEMVGAVEKVLGRKVEVERVPPPPGDMEITLASIEKASRLLDYAPRVGLEQGIERFVEWFRSK